MRPVISLITDIENLHLCINATCNQRCVFCYQKNYDVVLDPAIYNEKLASLYPRLKTLVLQGGEPTIIPEIREVVAKIVPINSQVKFTMSTNGKEFTDFWQSIFAVQGEMINFSVNAATENTYNKVVKGGDWKKTIDNINKFMRNRGFFNNARMSMVVVDDNLHEIVDFALLAKDMGMVACNFFFDYTMFPSDAALLKAECAEALAIPGIKVTGLRGISGVIDEKYPADKIKKCNLPWKYLLVYLDGQAGFCCYQQKYIGNLTTSSLESVWNSQTAQDIRREFNDGKFSFCDLIKCGI